MIAASVPMPPETSSTTAARSPPTGSTVGGGPEALGLRPAAGLGL